MVNPIVSTDYSSSQQQQEPQRRGSSKAKKAFVNGVVLGAAGAGAGAIWAPKSVKSVDTLLEKDTFEKVVRIPDKAPNTAKQALKTLKDEQASINAVIEANNKTVAELFPNESILHIEADKALNKLHSGYTSVVEAQKHIGLLEANAEKNKQILEFLEGKTKSQVSKTELIEIMKKVGYEDDYAQKVVKKATSKTWYKPGTWFSSKDEKINKIAKSITNDFKKNIDSQKVNPELKQLVDFLSDSKNVVDGKLSKEVYTNYIESKNAVPQIGEHAKVAFDEIKKYISKNRGKGAKVGLGIGVAAGVLLGLITGGKKKE